MFLLIQTIIQCLKYITTGVLPPAADRGKTFVMDPKIARTPQVKGEIRLKFKTAKDRHVIAKKILLLSKAGKGLSFRSIEQSLKTKDEEDRQVQVNQRCADIDRQIPEMLGMSKCILQNIVFCHQDDSLWPFSDNATLKGIFDELFDTKRFTKTMEHMKEAVKQLEKEKLELKGKIDFLKESYFKTTQNRVLTLVGHLQIAKTSEQLFQIRQQLKPLRQQLNQISIKQSQLNTLYQQKGSLEQKIMTLDEKLKQLKTQANQKKVNLILTESQLKQYTKILEEVTLAIEKKEQQIEQWQLALIDERSKQATNQKKIEFYSEIKRAQQIFPQLSSCKSASEMVQKLNETVAVLTKKAISMKNYKNQLETIIIQKLDEIQPQSIKSQEYYLHQKNKQAQNLLRRIQYSYNYLFNPKADKNKISAYQLSTNVEDKMKAFQAQIKMKKEELNKYKAIVPSQKNLEQEIFQLHYAGIQLQQECIQFINRKHKCLFCNKKFNEQELQAIKKKIKNTIAKTKKKIEEIQTNSAKNPQIRDPTPFIKEIEKFLEQQQIIEQQLVQEYINHEKLKFNFEQVRVNQEIDKIIKSLPIKFICCKDKQKVESSTVQNLRQLVNQYFLVFSEIKILSEEVKRGKDRLQKLEFAKQKAQKLSERKLLLNRKIKELEGQVKNLGMLQNINEHLRQLLSKIESQQQNKKFQQNQRSTQQQPENKIKVLSKEIKDLKQKKGQVELSIKIFEFSMQKDELYYDLGHVLRKLDAYEESKQKNGMLQKKKNQLEVEEATLWEKIKLKKAQYQHFLPEQDIYLKTLLRFNSLDSLIKDVNNSIKAMDRAINKVHNDKMDEINKILYDIWQDVYHARDIEFIRISSVTEKKTGYGYSIMMKKNSQLIEMKGRCSMGQKVLASLIIRMALAQAFSASTHILALDEPTTNLDRGHIENLAHSIGSILEIQQNSRLQLIIISHDLQFIQLLNKYTNYYYEIKRNERNFSTIKKRLIVELNDEKQTRLENLF